MTNFIEAGRDYSVEPTTEESIDDLRLDNARINAAKMALHILKTKLGNIATRGTPLYGYLLSEIAMVNKVKEIERTEETVRNFGKSQSKN